MLAATRNQVLRLFDEGEPATADLSANEHGLGRELFRMFRANATPAELGAGIL